LFGRAGVADAVANRTDADIAVVDVPAVGAVTIAAAGEVRHGCI
jgi:hypothetical protein